MAVPTVTFGTGVDTGSPVIPTHAAGNWIILAVATQGESVATPAGWSIVEGAPIVNSTIATLSLFKLKASSSSETDPAISGPASFYWAVCAVVSGGDGTTPIATYATAISTGSTTGGVFPGLKTISDENLVLNILAWAADNAGPLSSGEANASLTSVAEAYDAGTTAGGGGGIAAITGTKATAGDVAMTTCTLVSTHYAAATLAFQPPQAAAGGGGYSRSRVVNA